MREECWQKGVHEARTVRVVSLDGTIASFEQEAGALTLLLLPYDIHAGLRLYSALRLLLPVDPCRSRGCL
jgi:hypothetical protein